MRGMRLAVNMGSLRGMGSSAVGRGLLGALAEHPGIERLYAWIPQHWDIQDLPPASSAVIERVLSGSVRKFWIDNVTVRRGLSRSKTDLLFALGDTTLPLAGVPQLLLVQQAHLAYRPDEWGYNPTLQARAKMSMMAAYFKAGLSSVDRFAVQTPVMRGHLIQRWNLAAERVVVVPSSIELPAELGTATERLGGNIRPVLCYVAAAAEHKNHNVLPGMVAVLKKRWPDVCCQLTVTPWDVPGLMTAARRLGVVDSFEFMGRRPRGETMAALAAADVAVIPSVLESFGLTYFEAMALGRPMVVADRDFAREACGNTALYAQPLSPESYAAAVERLLVSSELRDTLASRGLARLARYVPSWAQVAERYVEVAKEVVGEG